jgi:RNA polymerase sigma factor (sigma-70 family)
MDINALHESAAAGDRQAEERLFGFLSVRFEVIANLKIVNAQDAEEVVQDALTIIAREYRSMTFERSFAAWAYKVFDNRVLSYFGSKKKHTHAAIEYDLPPQPQQREANPEVGLKGLLRTCLKKVRRANQRYARILALHYQGYDTEEICGRLEVTTANFYMILSRARAMLKRCLDQGEI